LSRRVGRFDEPSKLIDGSCAGKFQFVRIIDYLVLDANSICSFGINDIKPLLARFELFAHQFKLYHEPSGYFCMWAQIRNRTLDTLNQNKFEGKNYAQLVDFK
jgi:hypothetical protein